MKTRIALLGYYVHDNLDDKAILASIKIDDLMSVIDEVWLNRKVTKTKTKTKITHLEKQARRFEELTSTIRIGDVETLEHRHRRGIS